MPILFLSSGIIMGATNSVFSVWNVGNLPAILSIPVAYVVTHGCIKFFNFMHNRRKNALESAAKKWFQNDQASLPGYMRQESVAVSCDMVDEKSKASDCNDGTFFTMPFDLVNGIVGTVKEWSDAFRVDEIFAKGCAESISPATMKSIASRDPELCQIVKDVVYESALKTIKSARDKASKEGGLGRANKETAGAFVKHGRLVGKVVHDVLSRDSVADDGMGILEDAIGSTSCTSNIKDKTLHYVDRIINNSGKIFPLTAMDDVKLVECVGKGFSAATANSMSK